MRHPQILSVGTAPIRKFGK